MRLPGRKGRPSLTGPDGTKYVVVPMERTESWYLMLCQKAVDRVENPVARWVYLAEVSTFSDTVRKMRGEASAEARANRQKRPWWPRSSGINSA
jgi:chlorite dismutase